VLHYTEGGRTSRAPARRSIFPSSQSRFRWPTFAFPLFFYPDIIYINVVNVVSPLLAILSFVRPGKKEIIGNYFGIFFYGVIKFYGIS